MRRPGTEMRALAAAMLLVAVSGCAEFGYYLQSIDGQLQLNAARQPVEQVIADSATPAMLKQRLVRATSIREFASSALKLPDNGSYRSEEHTSELQSH